MQISSTVKIKEYNLLLIIVSLSVFGCDNTLAPLDKETGVYAIYGALDMDEQTNYIRIRDLKAPFTSEATEFLDAQVIFENLMTGDKSTLAFERQEYDGVYLHNFVVHGEMEPNTKYMVSTKRSDGVSVSLSTVSPTRPEPVAFPINQNCYTPITVEFTPTNGGIIAYEISYNLSQSRSISFILEANETDSSTMLLSFTPKKILSLFHASNISCYNLKSPQFKIRYAHYSKGLYPYNPIEGGVIRDPFNILQSTQVFGTYYKDSLIIPIDTSRVCPQECE